RRRPSARRARPGPAPSARPPGSPPVRFRPSPFLANRGGGRPPLTRWRIERSGAQVLGIRRRRPLAQRGRKDLLESHEVGGEGPEIGCAALLHGPQAELEELVA